MKKTLSAEFSGASVAALGFLVYAPFADKPWTCLFFGVVVLFLDMRVRLKTNEA